MSESSLQACIKKMCKENNILCYKWSSPSCRGVPDLILVFPSGRVTFVEVKNPNGKGRLSDLQKLQIDKLTKQGASVYVCDSKEIATHIINEGLRS